MQRLLTALALTVGCGVPAPIDEPSNFIALQRDFEDFESWEPFTVDGAGTDTTHPATQMTLYLNQRPKKGSGAFGVKTIIVKVIPPTAATEELIFAMVKRGGDYNAAGAVGWEWFELGRSTTGPAVIVWRGRGAPEGHRYSQVNTSCNDCHVGAAANDYVRSPPLQLGEL